MEIPYKPHIAGLTREYFQDTTLCICAIGFWKTKDGEQLVTLVWRLQGCNTHENHMPLLGLNKDVSRSAFAEAQFPSSPMELPLQPMETQSLPVYSHDKNSTDVNSPLPVPIQFSFDDSDGEESNEHLVTKPPAECVAATARAKKEWKNNAYGAFHTKFEETTKVPSNYSRGLGRMELSITTIRNLHHVTIAGKSPSNTGKCLFHDKFSNEYCWW